MNIIKSLAMLVLLVAVASAVQIKNKLQQYTGPCTVKNAIYSKWDGPIVLLWVSHQTCQNSCCYGSCIAANQHPVYKYENPPPGSLVCN